MLKKELRGTEMREYPIRTLLLERLSALGLGLEIKKIENSAQLILSKIEQGLSIEDGYRIFQVYSQIHGDHEINTGENEEELRLIYLEYFHLSRFFEGYDYAVRKMRDEMKRFWKPFNEFGDS